MYEYTNPYIMRVRNKSSSYFLEKNNLKPRLNNAARFSVARFRSTYFTNPNKNFRLGSPTIYKFKPQIDENEQQSRTR